MKFFQLIFATSILIPASAFAAEHEIKMLNNGADGAMVFEPGYIKAEKGDTLKFLITDAGHNTKSLAVPEEAENWDSEMGKEITVTLDKEGVYLYQCTPHAVMAMVGVVQVGDNKANLDDVKKTADTLKSTFVMNKDRLDKYLEQVENAE